MENRKDSYIILISNLYLLLGFAYTIYSFFFGIKRLGQESFHLFDISNNMAIIIGLIEILLCIIIAYILHRCNKNAIRYSAIVICLLNILYRASNLLVIVNVLNVFSLIIGIILLFNLIFY